jgi:hypothetical protein
MVRLPLRATPLLLVLMSSLGCEGSFVNLGSSDDQLSGEPESWQVEPEPLLHERGFSVANPTLTADQLKLYYSQQRRGGSPEPYAPSLMYAVSAGAGFSAGSPLAVAESDALGVASPAIAPNGRELFFSRSNENGDTDIWRSTGRADRWSEPELVSELNSDFDDAPRPPALGGTVMALSSKRHGGLRYQIYFAQRASPASPFAQPSQEHLGAVNSPDFQSADALLSADGRALYFSSTRGARGDSDLYVARRADPDGDFGTPVALSELDTEAEERMPWLSEDGQTLYFVSDRPPLDEYAVYVARRR